VTVAALLAGGCAAALAQAPEPVQRVDDVTFPSAPIDLRALQLTFPVQDAPAGP